MLFAIGTRNKRTAFSLVELILVMTVMIIVMSIIFPSLKGFFHGRNVDNEARQFLSLTRYGRTRAIAEGIPVELWINPRQESYGLQALSGYTESKTGPTIFKLDSSVQISLSTPSSTLIRSNYWTQTIAQAQSGFLTKIRFQPDGFISDTSPENIFFRGDTGDVMWLAENSSHQKYELQAGQPKSNHR